MHLQRDVAAGLPYILYRQVRRLHESHVAIHETLLKLSADRAAAAAGRLEVRTAIQAYVRVLRAEHRAPEVALRMTKRAFRASIRSTRLGCSKMSVSRVESAS